jgi:hypothetical protein
VSQTSISKKEANVICIFTLNDTDFLEPIRQSGMQVTPIPLTRKNMQGERKWLWDVQESWPERAVDNKDLIAHINRAFQSNPIPFQIFSTPGKFDGDMAGELRNRFSGREWRLVTLDDWRNVACVGVIMNRLTPAAFHYYVPSILAGVLDNPDSVDWALEALISFNK